MELTILATAGCPGASLLQQRLAEVLSGRPDLTVIRCIVADADEAASWGLHGSPTLLVDGADPFPAPVTGAALACRCYPDGAGRLAPAPTVAALRQVLDRFAPPG